MQAFLRGSAARGTDRGPLRHERQHSINGWLRLIKPAAAMLHGMSYVEDTVMIDYTDKSLVASDPPPPAVAEMYELDAHATANVAGGLNPQPLSPGFARME